MTLRVGRGVMTPESPNRASTVSVELLFVTLDFHSPLRKTPRLPFGQPPKCQSMWYEQGCHPSSSEEWACVGGLASERAALGTDGYVGLVRPREGSPKLLNWWKRARSFRQLLLPPLAEGLAQSQGMESDGFWITAFERGGPAMTVPCLIHSLFVQVDFP